MCTVLKTPTFCSQIRLLHHLVHWKRKCNFIELKHLMLYVKQHAVIINYYTPPGNGKVVWIPPRGGVAVGVGGSHRAISTISKLEVVVTSSVKITA